MGLVRFKKYILIGLILTSVVQVGILWDFNFHGFPFNFIRAFQTSGKSVTAADFFSPKRIIVSSGQSKWVVNNDSDTKDIYNSLWSDAVIYMEKLVSREDLESVSLADEDWSDIVMRKSISIEFDTPLSRDLIGYFTGTKVKNESGSQFVKLVISPWDSENYSTNRIYLLDNNNRAYKYDVEVSTKNLKKEFYDTVIEKLKKLQDDQIIRNYMVFSESKLKQSFEIRPDMLVSVSGNKYDKLGQINVSIPENFHITQGTKLTDIENIVGSFLGSEKDSFDILRDQKGTVVLKNYDNLYRIYSNGVLEYKKTANIVNEKGSKVAALENALSFIKNTHLIQNDVQVYLSKVEESKESYKFTFNYKVSNVPVFFDIDNSSNNSERITNAIVIESNADSTLSCRWVLRDIEVLKDKKIQYNVNFFDILDSAFVQYPDMKQNKDFSIQDVLVGYKLTDNGVATKMDPLGLVMDSGNNIYSVKLAVKKGD